jgi:hypothetical protein
MISSRVKVVRNVDSAQGKVRRIAPKIQRKNKYSTYIQCLFIR